jgi:SAM-dependent methyltransferase
MLRLAQRGDRLRIAILMVAGTAIATAVRGSAGAAEPRDLLDSVTQILGETGAQGGLIVHLGCGDGQLTVALRIGDRHLVHGLDTDAAAVATVRRNIRSCGRYGPVSADTFDGRRLPYIDNSVNLLPADDLGDVSLDEVMRVLAPGGVAVVGGKKRVKSKPANTDEWTHYLHDASGNPVTHDEVVGPPRRLQWSDRPGP